MSFQKINKEALSALLRFGRKNSGVWDDDDVWHGEFTDENSFLPDDSNAEELCLAWDFWCQHKNQN